MSTDKFQEELILSGKTIIVTRPENQSGDFIRNLESLGAEIINFPTITIKPVKSAAFDSAMAKLSAYDWIILTSANGATIFFDKFFENESDIRQLQKINFAVTGPRTAEILKKYGLFPALVPEEYVSEAIIREFAKINLSGKRFLLPGAAIAREIIPEKLRELGALVDNITVYDTLIPEIATVKSTIETIAAKRIDYITFSSSSTVINLLEILKDYNPEKILNTAKLVCIGPVTGATVTEKLNKIPLIAETYTTAGIIAAIITDIKKSAV